jgi:VanZ family protein
MSALTGKWRTLLRCLWFTMLALVIFGSLAPASSAPIRALGAFSINDKVQHVGAYIPLALLPMLTERRRRAFLTVGLMAALGVALEFGQMASEGRTPDSMDALADFAGLAIGVLGARLVGWLIG